MALVTGAARGIGRATALALAADGHAVAVNYRSDESAGRAADVVRDCLAAGARAAVAVRADVRDEAEVKAMVERVTAELGPVTVCVNNAGALRTNYILLTRPDDFRDVLETNLVGTFIVTKAVLRGMMRLRRGCIVNVASDAADLGDLMRAPYSASKAGVVAFTRTAARELAAQNIAVNAVSPGMIETDLIRDIPETRREKMLESIPLRRFGTPEEVAAAIRFLTKATYITGAVLHVNGGLM